MEKRRCFLLFLFLFQFSFAFSAELKISKISFGKRFLYLSLESDVRDEISLSAIIGQGIPVNIEYRIVLYQLSDSLFGDKEITNFSFSYRVKRDEINNGYEIEGIFGEQKIGKWYSSWQESEHFLLNPRKIRTFSFRLLDPTGKYVFEVSQSISSLRLFPPLSWLYQMLGNWNYHSPKIRSRKFTRNGIYME